MSSEHNSPWGSFPEESESPFSDIDPKDFDQEAAKRASGEKDILEKVSESIKDLQRKKFLIRWKHDKVKY